MNRPQKKLLTNLVVVLTITIVFVVFMVNVRNSINTSEAVRSMKLLGDNILSYRRQFGALPSESYLEIARKNLGIVRLGNLHYRAQWIDFGADANSTILAYTTEPFKKFFQSYHIVLWLDGRVEQYSKIEFKKITDTQQNEIEIEWLRKNLLRKQPQMPAEPGIF